MDPADLERVVHRALKAMPDPTAPPTLLPRVMAAVRAAQAVAPAARVRTWFTWPLAWQAAWAAGVVLTISAIVWLLPSAHIVATSAYGMLGDAPARIAEWAQTASRVASATSILGQAFLLPLLKVAFVLVIVMGGACAAFGTALSRVAFGGASQ
jgi:hypothetical protein